MDLNTLRREIGDFLGYQTPNISVSYEVDKTVEQPEYTRSLIKYQSLEGDEISAFLLIPKGQGPFPGVIVHHQHNQEWHLGKSEVCGIIGESLQSFGHGLANRGMVVLAPDTVGFEDRRRNCSGVKPEPSDWLQYYNEMCYRLVVGDTLIRKILLDAALGVSLLTQLPEVDKNRIGALGHSMGGNTVLFQTALDERISFACASGAACSYKNKLIGGTGIEMAEVIPGFAKRFDIDDLVKCVTPRRMLLVSASEDRYSRDAVFITDTAGPAFEALGVPSHLRHERFQGGHSMTRERFKFILDWMGAAGGLGPEEEANFPEKPATAETGAAATPAELPKPIEDSSQVSKPATPPASDIPGNRTGGDVNRE